MKKPEQGQRTHCVSVFPMRKRVALIVRLSTFKLRKFFISLVTITYLFKYPPAGYALPTHSPPPPPLTILVV